MLQSKDDLGEVVGSLVWLRVCSGRTGGGDLGVLGLVSMVQQGGGGDDGGGPQADDWDGFRDAAGAGDAAE